MSCVLFSTAFRLGNNPSGNGVDKVILNGVVQRGTDSELRRAGGAYARLMSSEGATTSEERRKVSAVLDTL